MTRDITELVEAETEAANLNWGLLLELELDNGNVNVWTGVRPLEFDGKTWLGVGNMGNLSSGGIESITASDNRIEATLSGIPDAELPGLITELQSGNPTNRPWSLFITMLDANADIISDPALISSGEIDSVSFSDTPVSSVTLVLANEAARMKKSQFFSLNDADQDVLFSGDKGMEFTARLQDVIRAGSLDPLRARGGGRGGEDVRNRRR